MTPLEINYSNKRSFTSTEQETNSPARKKFRVQTEYLSGIHDIPFELIEGILCFCSLRDSLALAATCQHFFRLLGNHFPWKNLYLKTLLIENPKKNRNLASSFDPLQQTYRDLFFKGADYENILTKWKATLCIHQKMIGENYRFSKLPLLKQKMSIILTNNKKTEIDEKILILLKYLRLCTSSEDYFEVFPHDKPYDNISPSKLPSFHCDILEDTSYFYCLCDGTTLTASDIRLSSDKELGELLNFYFCCEQVDSDLDDEEFDEISQRLHQYIEISPSNINKRFKIPDRASLNIGKLHYFNPDRHPEAKDLACSYFLKVLASELASNRDQNAALFYHTSMAFHGRCEHYSNDEKLYRDLEHLKQAHNIPWVQRQWVYLRQGIMRYEKRTDKINDQKAFDLLNSMKSKNYFPPLQDWVELYKIWFVLSNRASGKIDIGFCKQKKSENSKIRALGALARAIYLCRGQLPENKISHQPAKIKEFVENILKNMSEEDNLDLSCERNLVKQELKKLLAQQNPEKKTLN